jgi:hypothetical protein
VQKWLHMLFKVIFISVYEIIFITSNLILLNSVLAGLASNHFSQMVT